jgi:hypothetical protein
MLGRKPNFAGTRSVAGVTREGKEAGNVPGRARRLAGDLRPKTLQARASAVSPPAEGLGRCAVAYCAVPIAFRPRAGSVFRQKCCEPSGSLSRVRGRETRPSRMTWLNPRRSLGADPTERQGPTDRRDQAPDSKHFP